MSEFLKKAGGRVGGRADGDGGLQATRVNRSTMMMGLMFAVGIGWVIWESRQIAPPQLDADQEIAGVMVDSGLSAMDEQARPDSEGEDQVMRMVQAFYTETRNKQIPLSGLTHNPFLDEHNLPEPVVETPVDPTDVKPTPVPAQAPPVANLRLRSTMHHGDRATAMISGHMVREGQVINGWTIERIASGYVVLRWQDKKHVLKLP